MQATRRVPRAGRLEPLADVLLDGIERREPRCRHRGHDHGGDDDKAEQCGTPSCKPRGEHRPLASYRRGLGGGRDDDAHRRRILGSRYVYRTSTTRLTRTNVAASVKTAACTTG